MGPRKASDHACVSQTALLLEPAFGIGYNPRATALAQLTVDGCLVSSACVRTV